MEILNNNITANISSFSDPGDYPSGMGCGPLPDGEPCIDSFDGYLIVRLTQEEFNDILDCLDNLKDEVRDYMQTHIKSDPCSFIVEDITFEITPSTLQVESKILSWESFYDPDEPEYDD